MRPLIGDGSGNDDGVISPLFFSGIALACLFLLVVLLLHIYIIFSYLRLAAPSSHLLRRNNGEEEGGAPPLPPIPAANCVVCQTSLAEDGGAVKVLPRCKHVFHTSCIGRWLNSYSVRCPLCRTPAIRPAVGEAFIGSYQAMDEAPHLPRLFY